MRGGRSNSGKGRVRDREREREREGKKEKGPKINQLKRKNGKNIISL